MTSVRFFELRHGGDLPASAAELKAEGFRPSEGTTVSVVGDGEVLCLSLWNPASVKASREGRTFRWDSATRTVIEPGELGSGACTGLM